MGFINPGKSLKRKKWLGKAHLQKKAKKDELDQRGPLSLSGLPVEIIYKIFIFSKPNNNLPLVSKDFNRLLRFNPEYGSDSGNWRNLALVIDMIRQWYLVDLNTRIDFDLINKKLQYYRNRLLQLIQQYAYHQRDTDQSIETNENYKMITKNIQIVSDTIYTFQLNSNRKGISDKVLSNKFVSKKLVEHLFKSKVFCSANDESREDYLNLMSEGEIVYERKTRLRFLRYKFKELSILSQYLANQISNDTLSLPNTNESGQTTVPELNNIESTEELIMDENEKLPEYDDEKQRIEPWLLNSTTNLSLPFKFVGNTAEYDFAKVKYNKNFPSQLYRNGIHSVQKLQLLELFHKIYAFRFEDTDEIVMSSLHHFKRENILDIDTTSLSLDQILKFVISVGSGQLSQSPVISLLQLYNEYEPQDCSEFGVNIEGDLVSEDISKALIRLLTAFYEQNEFEDRDIWRFVLDCKNFNLAQLLMRFSECPSFELL